MDQIDNINTNLESQNNSIQVEVIQMSLPKSKFNLNVNLALKQECKCWQLAPIELCSFRGNPSELRRQYEMGVPLKCA